MPTIDTTRASWILEQMVKIKQPVLLVGESGTSKTATIHNFLKNLNTDKTVCLLWKKQTIQPFFLRQIRQFLFVFSRSLWSWTSPPEPHHWTCRGTWRPMWRKGPKRSMDLPWEKDCWSLWMTWICQRYIELLCSPVTPVSSNSPKTCRIRSV